MTRSPPVRLLAGFLRHPVVAGLLVVGGVVATVTYLALPADSDVAPSRLELQGTAIAAPTDDGPVTPSPTPPAVETPGAEEMARAGPTPTPRVVALPPPTAAPPTTPAESTAVPRALAAGAPADDAPRSQDGQGAEEAPAAVLVGVALPTLAAPPADDGERTAAKDPAPTAEPTAERAEPDAGGSGKDAARDAPASREPSSARGGSDRGAPAAGDGGNGGKPKADGGKKASKGKVKGKGKNGGKNKSGKGKR